MSRFRIGDTEDGRALTALLECLRSDLARAEQAEPDASDCRCGECGLCGNPKPKGDAPNQTSLPLSPLVAEAVSRAIGDPADWKALAPDGECQHCHFTSGRVIPPPCFQCSITLDPCPHYRESESERRRLQSACRLGALAAENARLRERAADRDYWADRCKSAETERGEQYRLAEQAEARVAGLEAALAEANRRAEAAEAKLKRAYLLPVVNPDVPRPEWASRNYYVQALKQAAYWATEHRHFSGPPFRELAASIERGPEGGPGWWVTTEKVREALLNTAPKHIVAVRSVLAAIGIPAAWPEYEQEASDGKT